MSELFPYLILLGESDENSIKYNKDSEYSKDNDKDYTKDQMNKFHFNEKEDKMKNNTINFKGLLDSEKFYGEINENKMINKKRRKDQNDLNVKIPTIEQIDRSILNFDFEKKCQITFFENDVYCCLICNKYLQGKTPGTKAYNHSLEFNHNFFISLDTSKIYQLPDDTEIIDKKIEDIKFNILPEYTLNKENFQKIQNGLIEECYSVDGSIFYPGLITINNIKQSEFINVIIYSMSRVDEIRNFLLLMPYFKIQKSEGLLLNLSYVIKKIYNNLSFKTHISHYEFLNSINYFNKERPFANNPLSFLTWFINCFQNEQKEKININLENKNLNKSTNNIGNKSQKYDNNYNDNDENMYNIYKYKFKVLLNKCFQGELLIENYIEFNDENLKSIKSQINIDNIKVVEIEDGFDGKGKYILYNKLQKF